VSSPPADGRANAEAERVLSRVFRCEVRLVAGMRSRRKTFETDVDESTLAARLIDVFGD